MGKISNNYVYIGINIFLGNHIYVPCFFQLFGSVCYYITDIIILGIVKFKVTIIFLANTTFTIPWGRLWEVSVGESFQ